MEKTIHLTPFQAARLEEALAAARATQERLDAVMAFVLDAHGEDPMVTVDLRRLDGQTLVIATLEPLVDITRAPGQGAEQCNG